MPAEADGPGAKAAVMTLLWEGRRAAGHGKVAGLNLAQIAQAGIRIADEEGLAAVSMGRDAAECDYKRMSLYRYVPGREELLAIMTDAAYKQVRRAQRDPACVGWRPRTRQWASEQVSLLRGHLWLMETTIGPRMLGPQELSWLQYGCRPFIDAGLSEDQAFQAALFVAGQVRAALVHEKGHPSSSALLPTRQEEAVRPFLAVHHQQGQAVVSAVTSMLHGTPRDPELAWALDRCLEGLSSLVESRTTTSS